MRLYQLFQRYGDQTVSHSTVAATGMLSIKCDQSQQRTSLSHTYNCRSENCKLHLKVKNIPKNTRTQEHNMAQSLPPDCHYCQGSYSSDTETLIARAQYNKTPEKITTIILNNVKVFKRFSSHATQA